ncbi:MAG: penicillin-binding protein 2 [Micavibrio aeruginosavorus]|uniref:Penicillin-binding protein 2 n=1 Tax=Micavibrio aeruginosavorus TaxID=349221 RepID=A0A7T5UGB2_9BACT|nr:MAG: penicillin-binding protein 2 [Micavibrio aeruginosavorus]
MSLVTRLRKARLRIEGSKRSALDMAHGRLTLIGLGFSVLYLIVAARVVDLTLLQGVLPRLNGTVAEQAIETDKQQIAVLRADVTDRNGVLLATSLETASLYADPALISDPVRVAAALSKAVPGAVYGETLEKLQRKGRFIWLKRNLTPEEQYRILEMGEPGLQFKTEYKRIYPQGELAAHMVGYGSVDGQGLAGIERSFDELLAKGGKPLALTLDIRLQHILRRETDRAIREFSARGGAGVIMDVVTGEILAATSLPDFDPQNPSAASPEQLFNNVTLGVYEPGSTMKIFSTAALLDLKNPGLGMTFDTSKPLKVGRHTIHDYHPENRPMTIPEVFMHSSNIGSALMGQMVGTEGLRNFYKDIGMLDPVDIEISEKGRPLAPAQWRDINTLTAAFGHGISVSPLHIVAAASSIVRGGTLVKPTLILNEAQAYGAKNAANESEIRIVSPQTSHRMRQLMRLVVTDGTARQADVPGYNVGGKTGTAEKIVNGRYDRQKKISSFLGFFPMEAPRYAVFIMVDEPKGTKKSYGYATGGWVAAPAVGAVIGHMAPLLGMEPHPLNEEDDLSFTLKPYLHDKKEEGGQLATFTTE